MKYTRFEFGSRMDPVIRKYFIDFVVFIPIFAIFIGFLISKFVITPSFFKTKAVESGKPANYEYQTIKDRRFYIAQAGVFQSGSNAKLTAERIKSHNLTAFVMDEGQLYRVIVQASIDHDYIVKKVGNYKSAGYDCIIKGLNVQAKELPVSLRCDKGYVLANAAVKQTGDFIVTCSEILSGYAAKKTDYKHASDALKNTDDGIEHNRGELNGYNGSNNEMVKELCTRCRPIWDVTNEVIKIKDDENFCSGIEEKLIQLVYFYNDLVVTYNKWVTAR